MSWSVYQKQEERRPRKCFQVVASTEKIENRGAVSRGGPPDVMLLLLGVPVTSRLD